MKTELRAERTHRSLSPYNILVNMLRNKRNSVGVQKYIYIFEILEQ
jgi:hypothetical protein